MSSRILSLTGLKASIGRTNPIEAKEILENAVKFFDEDLSKAELELALQTIFDTEGGTIAFLNRTIKENKKFQDANVTIFCLWIKILQTHGVKIKFETYVEEIIQCTMRFITTTTQASAKEKEKAAIVLQEIFKNKLADDIDASEVVSKLLEVFNLKNRPGTFTQQVFILLGIISSKAPENISERNAELIRSVMIKTLEETVLKEETPYFNALAGALEGLNLFLMNFAPSPTENAAICDSIYVCVKKLSYPPNTANKSKAPFRCALDVFTRHYLLFTQQIYRDFKFWQECLSGESWLSSKIYDDRRKGIYAIQAFHKAIEFEFNKKTDVTENDKNILLFLIGNFRKTLENPESKSHENRIAIRGFGLMAKKCKEFFPDIIGDVLSLVIQRTELISLAEDNELRDSLEHFPDYVDALSQIIKQIGFEDEKISHLLINTIQSILVRLIRDYHYLSKAHTQLASNAICRALFNLSELNGPLFNDLLNKIILQGVIWTASHKLVYDANLDWETGIDWKENITYKYYLDLWQSLLEETIHCDYDKVFITKEIFNSLISNLLMILEKLNLKTKRRVFVTENGEDQEFYFCDPNIDLCPEKPKDFHIFFNLVDFYRDILIFSKYNHQHFTKWISEYCTKMITFITDNPLVSGFLKLLECGLVIAEEQGFFITTNDYENEPLMNSLSFLLKILIIRAQKVSGELQLACLELILKYPQTFYKDYLLSLKEIFKISFDLGKGTIWLAKLALTSLEKINDNYQKDLQASTSDLRRFYIEVLPKLDGYLQGKGFEEQIISTEIVKYKGKKRIRKSNLSQRPESSDLFEVQKKIFNFIGKLQPQDAILLLDKTQSNEDLVKWQIDQNIKLNLYCHERRLEIYLDTIIPRICYLACTSIDRKTKVAACELVHALMLYLLGAKIHDGTIWEELCSKILILGADNDITIQQMFEPLLRQLMHYMSKYENLDKGVDTLMKILMDGISNENNCAVRDLSALCIREFVEWSIKQTTPQQLAASPVSIEMILNQLRIYSFDSNVSRRIGSALAFNNLYRILREEESICDIFFIDLLYTFCINFKLTEELSSVPLGSINSELEQVSLSLDHVVRVLKQRSYLYRKPNNARKMPIAIGAANKVVLKDVVVFLLKEFQNKLMNYRRKCLAMVLELSAVVENQSSLSKFFAANTNLDFLMDICEGEKKGNGIRSKTTLRYFNNSTENPYNIIYNWMQHLLCSLDCYIWLLNNNALKEPKKLFLDAQIFIAVDYYFEKICWTTMFELIESLNSDCLSNISSTSTVRNFEIEEINRINAIKCIIKGEIFDFITTLLNNGCSDVIPDEFWESSQGEYFIKFITNFIFEPTNLGFEMKFNNVTRNYNEKVISLLRSIQQHCLNRTFYVRLMESIVSQLTAHIKMLTDKSEEFLYSDQISEYRWNLTKGCLFTLKNLEVKFYLDHKSLLETAEQLITCLFDGIVEVIFNKETTLQLQPNINKFANELMKIVFSIGDLIGGNAAVNIITVFVKCLLNEKALIMRGTLKTIKHGEHFFAIYKRAVFEYCKESFIEVIVPILFSHLCKTNSYFIIKVIIEINEYCYKHKQYDQGILQAIVDVGLKYFSNILNIISSNDEVSLIVDYISSLILACPITWKLYSYNAKQPEIKKYIIEKFRDKRCSLEQKSKIFNILPTLIGPDDFEDADLMNALHEVQSQHLPLRSSEFQKNSTEETGLKFAFKSLLDALITSKSYILLEFLLNATATDQKHIVEYMIREDLKIFIHGLSSTHQTKILQKVFEKSNNESLEPQVRLTIFERFVAPLIQNSSVDAIVEFYLKTFPIIATLIDAKFGFAKQGWAVEQALINRIIGFSLIELFFGCLPKEKYYYQGCPLISALLPDQNLHNVFIGHLSKKSFYARTDVFVTDDASAQTYFRKYQCAAYTALCAITCNTQTDKKFYLKFLFEEVPQKNEYIWSKLIDCSDNKMYIHDSQEMEAYARTKERFVSIRRLNPISGSTKSYVGQIGTSRYLQTQNVFSSSLSQDVSKIDMNYSMVRGDAEAEARKAERSNEVVSVRLERTELNKHEIMPTICGVIQHMHENGITPLVSDPVKMKRSYPWIVCVANSIDNFSNHKNIRIFLAQVVDNCRNVFEPYAHILFKPILSMLYDECAGTKLNFFMTDMIALLLSWTKKELHKPTSIEEIRLSSSLLQFLMKNAWNDDKHIYKYNLELIQTMISLWKNELEIPHKLLLDIIQVNDRTDSKANELGLVLNGVFLANGLQPWIERTKINYISAVFKNFDNNYTTVYQPAAHVYGMILGNLNKNGDVETLESAKIDVINKLKSYSNKRETKKEQYFKDILYGVHKNYPEILDSFKETLSFKVPSSLGAIKRVYLEMILTRLEAYSSDEVYNLIISIGIKDLLKIDEFQLLALHIFNKSLSKLSWNEIQNLFSILESNCIISSHSECRDVTYEILIYISQNVEEFCEADTPKKNLKKRADILLLKGLLDTDAEIQKRIFHFWSEEKNLSKDTNERIFSLISNYSLNCEKEFLGFCTQLILEPAIQNPESKQQIFQFETDLNNKLQEYEINTSSRIRSTFSMPPLFADSQNKFISGGTNYNYIRETPDDYFFEPTKNPTELSQIRTQFTLPSQSSLPFTLKPYVLNRRSQKMSGLESVEDSTQVTMKSNDLSESLRRRFLRDKEKENRDTVLRVIDKRTKKTANNLNKLGGKVTLYRRYRIGDYPDLLINSLAFLLPLQGIVKRDRNIARQIFVSIFKSLIDKLGPEMNSYIISIGGQIQNTLDNLKSCDPVVFSTFLELALFKADAFNLRPTTVATIAKACNMQTIGVIYLETRLNMDFEESEFCGPSTSKSSSVVTNYERHWLELSDIYNSLAEYDIVTAIFTDKIDADPRLAEAVELKIAGRYSEAQELLLKVIERQRLVEQNFAYNAFYECFEELGDWAILSRAVNQQLDDFEELWIDEYNTIYFLPKLMKSELQLILKAQPHNKEFIDTLVNWMNSDQIKAEYIKQTFSEELMMLQIANSSYLQARVHCEDHLKKFLLEWGIISSQYEKLRQENLLNAQKVAEIDYYAQLLIEQFDERVIDTLKQRWDNCKINRSDSLRYWNCLLSYRIYIASLFITNLENLNSENAYTENLQNSINKLLLQLFDAAIYQKNPGIVKQILKDLTNMKQYTQNQNDFSLNHDISQIKEKLLLSQIGSKSSSINTLEQIWIKINNICKSLTTPKEVTELGIEMYQLKSKISEELYKKLPTMSGLTPKLVQKFLEPVEHYSIEYEDFKYKLFEESLWSLKKSTDLAAKKSSGLQFDKNDTSFIANTYFRLAEFCYEHYQIPEAHLSLELEKVLVSSVFNAMRYNSLEGRQLFPFVMELPSLNNGLLGDQFSKESLAVPDWMFLNWIPQILTRLNPNQATYIDGLIIRIAKTYPNALIYQFNTWLDEKNMLDSENDSNILRNEIQIISNLLKCPFVDKFLKSMNNLRFPHFRLDNWITKVLGNFPKTQLEFIAMFTEVLEVFVLDDDFHGSIFREILHFKDQFVALQEMDVEKDEALIQTKLTDLQKRIMKSILRTDKYIRLENFSPFLANFHWCGEDKYIELPGQYMDDRRPYLETNVKIVKFDEKVEVFQSMRKPVRLKMFGSDARTHDFIVKFGDDLQQDQRIQQAFKVMGNRLQNDRQCCNYNLFIKTYKVIPFGKLSGMMSFVYDTRTIDDLILECFKRRQSNANEILLDIKKDFVKFIRGPTKHHNKPLKDFDVYGEAIGTYTRDQFIANFRNLQHKISFDVIKYALVDMSVSPESFYTLRNNYAKTLATMNISHWLLGIGDRHLQNILISTKDATLTGIDFSVILGGGIRNLVIPEFIPFRLTPQFVNVLNPLGTSGILFKSMAHALRVYRDSSKSLLACIEVFARIPTKDWLGLQQVMKSNWKPIDVLNIVKRKLDGDNPMHIMKKDLADSALVKHGPAYEKGYEKILLGDYQFNIRARLSDKNLSVEDQIKCLVDLATDPAILGCSYVGLSTWL